MPILKSNIKPGAESKPQSGGKSQAPDPNGGFDPKSAFAKKYAEVEANEAGAYVPPPPGTYEALITEAQGVIDGMKSSAYLECTIVNDENVAGKTCRIYFNFTGEDGKEGTGHGYFKQALSMLGVEGDFDSWQEMCDTLAELAKGEPWVIIDVKKKGKWTNIYLSSVPEDQSKKPSLEG